MTIEFKIYLTDENWRPTAGGWLCEALLIQGARVETLYYGDGESDQRLFKIERNLIRWVDRSKPKPQKIWVTIVVPGSSSKLDEEKLRLEKEKLNLERQNTKWKALAAIGPIIIGLLTWSTTSFVGQSISASSEISPQRVHTYTDVMSISEDRCITSATRSLENYGLQNVTPVQRGVYATQGSYNIFIGCNTETKAVVLVVSGPEDSEAKRIRENIKALLPTN